MFNYIKTYITSIKTALSVIILALGAFFYNLARLRKQENKKLRDKIRGLKEEAAVASKSYEFELDTNEELNKVLTNKDLDYIESKKMPNEANSYVKKTK